MVEFVNREMERAAIERALHSDHAELLVIYGRRGAGKSELLIHALADYAGFYYQATAEVMAQQLTDLSVELKRSTKSIVGEFTSSAAFLDALTDVATGQPDRVFSVVLDEFPYLADAEQGFETILQRWWDKNHKSMPNLKLFLAGSHVSWMNEHTLAEDGPLQNRRTGQIEVLPLTYRHAASFYPHLTPSDSIRAFGIWGGLPGYLRELDDHDTLWDLVAQTLMRPEARLAVEPEWLRFTDLRSDRMYTSVVRAIAMGSRRPSGIARAVGRSGAAEIIPTLNRLLDIGIVERVNALSGHDTGRPSVRYEISDPFIAFWYRFIDPRRGAIRRVRTVDTAMALAAEIKVEIDDYIARYIFEEVCREWIWEAFASGKLPPGLSIGTVGTWWSGREGTPDQLDVVALSPELEGVLYGECKWSVAPMDMRDLAGLRAAIHAAARDIPPIERPWRLLFSRSGFHMDLLKEAASPENRILLVDLNLLYE